MLNPDKKIFIVHIATITSGITIYSERKAQITLLKEKALISILAEYLDFANIFSEKLVTVLPEYTKINTHAIDLEKGKQLLYEPIYSLKLVELKTLKTHIKSHLKTGFIWFSKFPASTPILFDKKPDSSLRLYIDYQDLNNLTIKNWYLLPLIGELLNRLSQAKKFT